MKYTHKTFLLGQRCQDEELLKLIPIVCSANPNEVNGILYEWFAALGNDGYDISDFDVEAFIANLLVQFGNLRKYSLAVHDYILNYSDNIVGLDDFRVFVAAIEQAFPIFNPDMPTNYMPYAQMREALADLMPLFTEMQHALENNIYDNFDGEVYRKAILDMHNIYVGIYDSAYNFIANFKPIDDWVAFQVFKTEFNYFLTKESQDIVNIRPHVDNSWINETFLGKDLYMALSRFNEIHIIDRRNAPVSFDEIGNSDFSNEKSHSDMDFSDRNYRLLGLFRLWNAMKYFYPHMNIIDYDWNESLLEYIPIMLEGADRDSYVTTLVSIAKRLDDAHIIIDETATHSLTWHGPEDITASHVLLENNIGLINPIYDIGDTRHIMETFADTKGLIIDLRRYSCDAILFELPEYIVRKRQLFAIISSPSQSIPGVFVDRADSFMYSGSVTSPHAFFYDKPVVILMGRRTMSSAEYAVMSLRNGKNVTVIGSNSIGADGNVTELPLPGGITMQFTGLGIYTPEGGQTHRIGLSPDIFIEPTDDDIREGRDVLMEAAIDYILSRQ